MSSWKASNAFLSGTAICIVHSHQSLALFRWGFERCAAGSCGSMFLSPAPLSHPGALSGCRALLQSMFKSLQGQLWDAAWSQDCQYIAGSTIRARSNNETKVAVPRPGQDAGSWKSCMYYWRQDSSLVGSVECHHRIKKIIVDPANSAYIISLGVDGQVWVQRYRICRLALVEPYS